MNVLKKTIFILLGLGILIQFVPVDRPENDQGKYDFLMAEHVQEEVGVMLKNACFDCHSNQTIYPWYAYVAPVSWLVVRDVRVGRKHLNFSDWKSLSKKDRLQALDDIAEVVEAGEMPMKIYPPLHPKARLSDADREKLVEWSEQMAEKVFEE